ncbi:MAG: 7-cyano-7-deazaguanine synthase QueC [Cyanobacteria bacterium REEB65]|nr:7-cyano-7-deazaguanine synthase QueC [Cyanobacteria bacterium REEB65]
MSIWPAAPDSSCLPPSPALPFPWPRLRPLCGSFARQACWCNHQAAGACWHRPKAPSPCPSSRPFASTRRPAASARSWRQPAPSRPSHWPISSAKAKVPSRQSFPCEARGIPLKRAIVLLSGGLDSTTCAYVARHEGYAIHALSFDYGQRLRRELDSAAKIASAVGAVEHVVMRFDLRQWGGSALTADMPVPLGRTPEDMHTGIPVTYVPGRNTIFLAFGLSYAEAKGAEALYIGVNAIDSSGYPDCRPEFIRAFHEVARLGTKAGVEGSPVRLETPLLTLSKAEIVQLGLSVGADYALTWSCYVGGDRPCGRCDSCLLRAAGFAGANVPDPLLR